MKRSIYPMSKMLKDKAEKPIEKKVVGDEKYGSEKNPLERLGLHASKLEFIHPVTKELLTFTSPLPPSFRGLCGRY